MCVRCCDPVAAAWSLHTRPLKRLLPGHLCLQHTVLPLDASLIDVYNGAHCVLFVLGAYIHPPKCIFSPSLVAPSVFLLGCVSLTCCSLRLCTLLCCSDPSKPWTYDYVKRELERVPLHIPCAVLVGFRDYAAQRRAITLQQARGRTHTHTHRMLPRSHGMSTVACPPVCSARPRPVISAASALANKTHNS